MPWALVLCVTAASLVKIGGHIKPDCAPSVASIRYSAAVFPPPLLARSCALATILACAACVGVSSKPPAAASRAPGVFYTLTAEIALARHEPRVAALQYALAAAGADEALLRRATAVTAECLQPELTTQVAARWLALAPDAVDAHRAAAKANLELQRIDLSTAHYRAVLLDSPRGTDAEMAALETEFTAAGNLYGARQVADRLADEFPVSVPALRLKAFAALRADDPAAAVRSFEAALALPPQPAAVDGAPSTPDAARHELTQGLRRARILAGDADEPLRQAQADLAHEDTAQNRLEYALLLLAAQQTDAARVQLDVLAEDPTAKPLALRLRGLIDFQDGRLADAGEHFAELATTGKYVDDSLYYLGLIAERHNDVERALGLYAEVRSGDNAVPALLRAAAILRSHGAAAAAEELLDQLVDEEPQRAPEILIARARIYATAGDVPQALGVLEQALADYPDSVELRYAMDAMVEDQGRVTAALRDLKAVALLRPADPAALNAYGYTLADHNTHLRLARRLIERAYAAAPKSAAILDSLGWVLFRQGHGQQALPYLREAYADERDGDIAAHLGEVLWQLGMHSDADRIWSEASRADADNHLLKATQQRLHPSG